MKKEILINCHTRETRVAVLMDGKLDQFFLERGDSSNPVGNVYKGRVTSVLPGLEAAFVDIGLEKNGFLPMREKAETSTIWQEEVGEEVAAVARQKPRPRTIQKLLHKGQEIMVQVVKEPLAKKGARLTTQISLPGRFLVLMPWEKRIGVSRKIINRSDRHRLRTLLKEIKPPQNLGIILRTVALRSDKKSLKRDLKQLQNSWKAIEKANKKSSAPALLHEELALVMRNIRDSILTDVDGIMVDSRTEYKKINRFLSAVAPATCKKVVYYREAFPLFEKYHLEEEIARLFQARITLKCGGSIVLNQTEALVAVDVNTGKHKGKKDQARTALTANLEAAVEVAKQLRLRNVGGLVVIDFIDMVSKRYQRQVMSALLKELKKDRARTRVLPFSEFCLVEMTRQREQESFMRKLYQPCPFCNGQGAMKSLDSLELEVERRILRALSRNPKVRRYRIEAHPHLARYLLEEGWEDLRQMARSNRIRVSIIDNSSLNYQEYIIWILSRKGDMKG